MTPAHDDHLESCMKVFVPWRYMVAVVISLVIGIVTISAMTSSNVATVVERSLTNKQHIERLEIDVNAKLDVIIHSLNPIK